MGREGVFVVTESAASLLIGAVLGDSGAANMEWSRAIGRLSRVFEDASHDVASPLRVNVVFHVAGTVLPNEFAGVRTGRYRRADRLLVVQAAVPGGDPVEPERTLLDLLLESVVAAEEFARVNQVADGLPGLRELVTTRLNELD